MESLKNIEKRIDEIYKGKTSPEDIKDLALLKEDIRRAKEEDEKRDKSMTEIAEKYRDSLIQGGSFIATDKDKEAGQEEDGPVSFEDVLKHFLKKGKE